MTQSCDVAIVGGGVIGSAIAYFLLGPMEFPGRVIVVEKDPTYADAATSRSAGGIRQQFSTPENIAMSSFGASFVKHVGDYLSVEGEAPSIPFTEWGYLFLATPAGLPILEANHRTQRSLGADIALLDPAALKARFPWLRTDDLAAGTLGLSNEGWIDPYSLLQAFRRKARSLGVTYIQDEVAGLNLSQSRVTSVSLRSGETIGCGAVINCAGVNAWRIAAWIGLDLPVRPRKRLVYVIDCREELTDVPLTIDPTGVWFRPEGANFICGVSPEEGNDPDSTDFELDYSLFEEMIWPTLANRVPAFEAIKLIRAWAGHYDYNVLDQNVIIGPAPHVPNFLMANGFSGHGLQQSPAIGRALSELVTFGSYRTLDLRRFGYDRVLNGQAIREANVV